MKRTGIYYQVIPIADGMKKFARIENTIGALATHGKLFIGPEHTTFASQFEAFGPTYQGLDDDLDASALALQELHNPYLERMDPKTGELRDDNVEELNWVGACP